MTEKDTILSDPEIHWRDATSRNGNLYRIGVKKSGNVVDGKTGVEEQTGVEGKVGVTPTKKIPFSKDVLWPWVKSKEDEWESRMEDVKEITAITRWKLHELPAITPWSQWSLNITNTENYLYYFKDRTGDEYELDTDRTGDHFVTYRSENPAITRVRGS